LFGVAVQVYVVGRTQAVLALSKTAANIAPAKTRGIPKTTTLIVTLFTTTTIKHYKMKGRKSDE
jgi:hypothetical protein